MGVYSHIVFWFFVLVSVGTVLFVIAPTFYHNYYRKKPVIDKKIDGLVGRFLSSTESGDLGFMYVKLLRYGFFTSFRPQNHGRGFCDKRYIRDFRKHSTSEIATALREVGKSYERYNV